MFNTPFTTKKVDLNIDLMENAFLDKKLLNLQEKGIFLPKNNVKPSLGQKMSFSTKT